MKSAFRNIGLKLGIGAAAAAGALLAATPAMARDRYRDGGNDAAIAIGAGVLGLAVGAALADRDDRYYYDRDWYPSRRYVTVRGRPGYYYYYADRPNRYYRDRYYSRYYAPYYRSHRRDWRARRHHARRDWRRGGRDWRGGRHYSRRHGRHHDRGRHGHHRRGRR